MRVLHSAALLRPSEGMLNQMLWEQQAATELGISWDVRMYCPSGWEGPEDILVHSSFVHHEVSKSKWGRAVDWLTLRYRYYQWLLSIESQYDVFVLRYYVHDPFQLNFVQRTKRPVFFVHHTLEVPELVLPGRIVDRIRAYLESMIGRYTLGYATGLIGVTAEILEYEKSRVKSKRFDQLNLIYPNGINCQDVIIEDDRGEKIELLFVCSFFFPWHGLDLLIKSLQENNDDFVLHIVGEVSTTDYQYLITDKRVILHGKLSHREITVLSTRCHCGLSSFALFRNGMKEACTLKVREYLMLGLPVYAGYQDVFPGDFACYKNGDADIVEIIKYATGLVEISKKEVVNSAKEYIDKKVLLNSLYQEIKCRCKACKGNP